MIVSHNMDAEYTARMGKENESRIHELSGQLSSGYRLLHSKNDASGSTISHKMRSQIRGLDQASRNGEDGVYLLDIADGAASQIHYMLQRIRELAVQSANDVYLDSDRAILENESKQIKEEIDRIATETQYNTMRIIDGSLSTTGHGLNFQIGANENQGIEVLVEGLKTDNIGMVDFSIATRDEASHSISTADDAIQSVSEIRSRLGAVRNRLGYAIQNMGNMSENLSSAESRIADTDVASTMVRYAKESILNNAISAMLAQAMKHSYGALSLLQGGGDSTDRRVSSLQKDDFSNAEESLA